MISRQEAASIAEPEIISSGLGSGVREVLCASELQRRPPSVYGARLESCWIVYAERPLIGIFPNAIVLVDTVTGSIVYLGSANDEG